MINPIIESALAIDFWVLFCISKRPQVKGSKKQQMIICILCSSI